MPNQKKPGRYTAFVLRVWQEDRDAVGGGGEWRFSLQETVSNLRVGFHNLDALIAYLRKKWPAAEERHFDEEDK